MRILVAGSTSFICSPLSLGEPIRVFNHGEHSRSFIYIDDIVEGVIRTLDRVAVPDATCPGEHPDPATSNAPYRLYNIGNERPVDLLRAIALLEQQLGRKAEIRFLPLQPGDVTRSQADVAELSAAVDYRPVVSVEEGIAYFAQWYLDYHGHALTAAAD